jgi:hypothetical protein|uniref:Uncharacterized protein n=1 Tax=viral metagenome TaxID=1070528 RepID=A0A6C0B7K8_9ZZZZ
MEKALIIHKMPLPQELVDYICSFGFYTLEQCIEQNKKKHKKVLKDIKDDVRINNVPLYTPNGTIMYCIYIEFPIRQRKVIYANLCGDCNNFIHLKRKSFGCRCLF